MADIVAAAGAVGPSIHPDEVGPGRIASVVGMVLRELFASHHSTVPSSIKVAVVVAAFVVAEAIAGRSGSRARN